MLILCKYDRRIDDFFVLSWARVQHYALVSDASDLSINLPGAHVCSDCISVYAFHVLFDVCKCDIFVCFYMCGVFVVVECSSFLLSGCCMFCKRVEWVYRMCGCVGCVDV